MGAREVRARRRSPLALMRGRPGVRFRRLYVSSTTALFANKWRATPRPSATHSLVRGRSSHYKYTAKGFGLEGTCWGGGGEAWISGRDEGACGIGRGGIRMGHVCSIMHKEICTRHIHI